MKLLTKILSLFLIAVYVALNALFLAPVVVSAQTSQQEINQNLCNGSNFDFSAGASTSCADNGGQTINDLIRKVINILSLIVGTVAVIMIIVGGLRYITSGGNDSSVTGAKNTILYAIIGLVIVALAQVIVHFVLSSVTSATS